MFNPGGAYDFFCSFGSKVPADLPGSVNTSLRPLPQNYHLHASKRRSKINQNWFQNRPEIDQNRKKSEFQRIWIAFCPQNGARNPPDPPNLPCWTPLVPQVESQKRSKIFQRSIPNASIFGIILWLDFGELLDPILVVFPSPKWSPNRSSIGFKSDHGT